MSVEFYLVCHGCKKKIHIAQDGFSGFRFYSKHEACMKVLQDFLAEHVFLPDHQFQFTQEGGDWLDEYMEIEYD